MKFTLTIEQRDGLMDELQLRAWQERATAAIGRTTKAKRDAHEHAAVALESLAAYISKWEVRETPQLIECSDCGKKYHEEDYV